MRKNRIIIFLIFIILCLFALNGAFASDINDETIFNEEIGIDYQLNDDINDNDLLSNYENDLENDIGNGLMSDSGKDLLNDNPNSFSALNQTINGNQDDSVYLNADYTFNGESDSNLIQGIPIERNLTVYGNGHTLNANSQSRIFNILNNKLTVVFKDIIFINGNGTNGGAIYGKSSFINCTFKNNTADYGGAIYAQSNNFDIINCTFEDNIAKENGGAIYFDTVTGSTINNSAFKNNKAKNGGALSSEYSQKISILNSNFTDNEAGLNGGAMDYYFSMTIIINFCRFENNMATEQNGGALSFVLSKGNISNNRFNSNSAKENGGAIYFELDNSPSIVQGQHLSECNFTANNAKNGGAIYNNDFYVISDGTLRFNGNFADENGGAVYCRDNCVFNNSRFVSNSALGNGGAIYCGDRCRFVGSTFLTNEASGNGGAVYANDRPYFEKSNFTINEAENGGAIYCRNSSTFIDSSFLRNLAVKNGGAVYSSDNAFFMDSNFTENNATNGGATYSVDFANFYRVNFIDNSALENGSAAYGRNNNTFNGVHCTGNNASYGAVYCLEGNQFSSCEFVNNTAHSGSAIYMDRYNSVNDSTFLSNKADSEVSRFNNEDLTLTFFLQGSNKFINAIFSSEIFDYSNITYWAGEIVNSDDVPITYGCPGINFTIDIYDSNNNLINRTVLETDEIGHFNFDYSFLDGGSYTCLVYHEEDDYYYNYTSNFTLSFGDFEKLQYLLRKSNDNEIINLTENYTYSPDLDGEIYSLLIPKNNITVNGNGFVIDSTNKYVVLEADRKVSIKFLNCTFANNLNIDFSYMENVSFIDCNFINSSALSLSQVENAQIVNCTFVNTSSGIYADYGGTLEIINCSFENCTGATYGGASRFGHNDNVTLINCNFTGNNANVGGAIFSEGDNLNLLDCTFINNSANSGGAILISGGSITVDTCEFMDNSAEEGSAIYIEDIDVTLKNSLFLNNHAFADSLNVIMGEKSQFLIYLKAKNNYINAIYSTGSLTFENVTYWNGRNVNSDDVLPIQNSSPGINITLEIYDEEDNFIKNYTVVTDDEGNAYCEMLALGNGTYKYNAYHLDDKYYSYVGECNGSFVISRAKSSVSIKIDDETEFDYGDCNISFEVWNRTVVRIIIANYEYEILVNRTTDDDFIFVDLKPSEEYYLLTVINLPTLAFEGSQDFKLFRILKPGSSISVDEIGDIFCGENITVNFTVENMTTINVNIVDANNETVFSANTTNSSLDLPLLPAGTYNLTAVNMANENYNESSCSVVFNVLKAGSSISVDAIGDVVYGDDTAVSFAVENKTMVMITVVDGNNVTVFSVNTTEDSAALPLLPVGSYNLTAVNVENGYYNESSCSVVFNVLKAGSSISVDAIGDVVYGDVVSVNFSGENLTVVNVAVVDKDNNTVYSANVTDNFTIADLAVGVYNLTLLNLGNENYNESGCSVVFNVVKAGSSISVDPIADVVLGDVVSVSFSGENLTVVNVAVVDKDNNTVYSANVTDNFTIADLAVGVYNVTLINLGNENYTESSCSVVFNVVKAGSSISVDPIADVVYGNDVSVSFSGENLTVVNVAVVDKDNNTVYSANVTDNFTIADLVIGVYNLTLRNLGSESFEEISASIVFNVVKAGSSINVDVIEDIPYNTDIFVNFVAENLTVVNVSVRDKDNNTVYSANVTEQFTIPALPVGAYNLSLVNIENEFYKESSCSIVFNVVKAASSISVDPIADVVYGDVVSVNFSGENLTVVNVAVVDKDNNTVYTANVTESPFTISDLAAGTYNITLINLGNETHRESNASVEFTVVKAGSSISVDPIADVVYGEDINVKFSGENLTVVNFAVVDKDNNTVYSANVTDNFTIVDLAVGVYNITLINLGDENYGQSSAYVVFNVVKAASSISVDPISDVVYGDVVSVSFAGENLTVVNVSVVDKDNNTVYSVNVTESPFTISDLAAGAYNVTLINLGNENYTESSCSAVFNVVKAGSSISVDPISDVVYGDVVSVSFAGENLTVVDVVVIDKNNNTVYSVNVTESPFTVSDLAAGTYNVTLINLGDENYGQSSASVVFNVVKAGSSISVDPIADVVYGNDVSVSFSGENLTVVNVAVVDKDNNTVYSANVTESPFTVSDLAAGAYNVTLINLGDENYGQSSAFAVFNVVKVGSSISVEPIGELVYGEDINVKFSGENLTVVNVAVVDKDNNTVYSANVTDNFTIADLAVGVYNVTLINLGNENYTESSCSVVFNVVKAGSSISVDPIADVVYGNDVSVSFSGENLTVVNVAVVDKDNNTVYSANVTDNFTIADLAVGVYNVTLINLGNENYTESSCSVVFNVVKAGSSISVDPIADVVYGNDVSVSFSGENLTVVNVAVVDKDNNIVYSANVTDNFTIADLAVGVYNVTLINLGNDNYTESSCSVVFNVVKAGSSISVDPIADVVYGNDVSVSFSGENLTVVNVAVVDKNNNTVYSANLTDNFTIPGLAAGTYNISLKNIGNENYTESNVSALFNVLRAASSITVVPIADAIYGDEITVNFDVENRTVVNVTVRDKDNLIVFSVNATGDSALLPVLPVGIYVVTAVNVENEFYNESSDFAVFNVLKAASSIILEPVGNFVYGDDVSIRFYGENLTVVNVIVKDKDNNTVRSVNVTESPAVLAGLDVGDYNVTLINLESESYYESSCSAGFTIVNAGSSISVDPIDDFVYGNNLTVSYAGENLTVVNVAVRDRDNNIIYTINVSSSPFTIPVLPGGTYNLTLRNLGDENYGQSSDSVVFTILKAGSSISVDPIADVVYGDNVSVIFSADNLTVVNVTVRDKDNNIVDSFKVAYNFTIPELSVGTYNITLVNMESESFNESSCSTVFNVVKTGSSISVDPIGEIVYGSDVSVSFSGENLTVVNVSVVDKDNKTVYSANVSSSPFSIPVLPVGVYNITLRNMGNENYGQSSVSAEFIVVKAGSFISVDPISDVVYGNDVSVSFSGENLTVVNVSVVDKDNKTVYSANVSSSPFSIPVLPVGVYNITLRNLGNETHDESSCSAVFTVVKAGSFISVDPISDVVYGNDVSVSFSGENLTVVNVGVVDKDNKTVYSANVSSSPFSIPVLPVGVYNITLRNLGNETHDESSCSAEFIVVKAGSSISVDPISDVVYGSDVSVSFSGENLTVVEVSVVDKDNKTVYSANVSSSPFSIPVLPVGVYNITLRNMGNENYTESKASVEFAVVKAGSSISVDPISDVVYGNDVSVSFSGENLTVVEVSVVDKDNKTVYRANVTDDFTISGLVVGTYNITLRNMGNENYTESNASVEFAVVKAGSSISVDPISDVVYGNDVSVSFSGENLTVVNVSVVDKDNITVFSDEITESSFTVSDLAAGTYTVTLRNLGNETHGESSVSAEFIVVKAASSISVDPISDVVYGEDASVSFSGENLTVVNVSVVDKDNKTVYSANHTEGPVVLSDLAAGVYNITLRNTGNENYTESSVSAVFTVVKAGSSISVDPISDVVYGNDVSVSFTGENLTVVSVAVVDKDNNTVYSANVSSSPFSIPVLPVGTYNVTLRNMGNENYTESSSSAIFKITQAENNATVIANNVVYGDYATIIINATVDGEYTLDVNGSVMPVTVVGGMGNVTLDLDIGEYYAQVSFENSNYNTTYVNAIFNVLPVDQYDMTVNVNDALDGEDVIVTVILPRKATGNVTVQIGDDNYTSNVVNGTATISIPNLKAGNTTATVIYSGDEYYYSSTMTKVIHVKKVTISMSDAKYGWSKTITYQVKLTDEDGKALSNKEVIFSVAGKTIKARTNASGIATVQLSLNIGKHVIQMSSIYGNASRTITVVSRFSGNKNIKMYYFDGTKYTFKVYGDNGKLVGANQVVTVKLKKKTYKLKTNKNGVVTLKIPKTVKPGKYTISASYKGQTIKNTIRVKKILKSKKTVKVKKTAKKLVLKAQLRKKLKGKRIIFKFRGKKYKAKTNKKGIAKVTIKKKVLKKLKRGKTYRVKIYYYKTYIKTKVKVKR